jgi:hypothetical protein
MFSPPVTGRVEPLLEIALLTKNEPGVPKKGYFSHEKYKLMK